MIFGSASARTVPPMTGANARANPGGQRQRDREPHGRARRDQRLGCNGDERAGEEAGRAQRDADALARLGTNSSAMAASRTLPPNAVIAAAARAGRPTVDATSDGARPRTPHGPTSDGSRVATIRAARAPPRGVDPALRM
jgi:hypothetical protein